MRRVVRICCSVTFYEILSLDVAGGDVIVANMKSIVWSQTTEFLYVLKIL